jgi:hypothetical protein
MKRRRESDEEGMVGDSLIVSSRNESVGRGLAGCIAPSQFNVLRYIEPMKFANIPLPEDWNDLPDRWRERIPQDEWSVLRDGLRKAAEIQRLVDDASASFTAIGVKNERLEEMAPVLDALRRVRAVLDMPLGERLDVSVLARLSDAVNDLQLEMTVSLANVQARIDKATALTMDAWSAMPQETLPDSARELVREWLAGKREERLAQMSLEDRAEVEEQDRRNRGG